MPIALMIFSVGLVATGLYLAVPWWPVPVGALILGGLAVLGHYRRSNES